MNIARLCGTGSNTARQLAINGRKKGVAVKNVFRGRRELCSGDGRRSDGVPFVGVNIRGRGAGLEDTLTEGVVAVGGRCSAGIEAGETVGIIVRVCGGGPAVAGGGEIAVVVVRVRGGREAVSDRRHGMGVGVARPSV